MVATGVMVVMVTLIILMVVLFLIVLLPLDLTPVSAQSGRESEPQIGLVLCGLGHASSSESTRSTGQASSSCQVIR